MRTDGWHKLSLVVSHAAGLVSPLQLAFDTLLPLGLLGLFCVLEAKVLEVVLGHEIAVFE